MEKRLGHAEYSACPQANPMQPASHCDCHTHTDLDPAHTHHTTSTANTVHSFVHTYKSYAWV